MRLRRLICLAAIACFATLLLHHQDAFGQKMLQIRTSPTNFDTTECGSTKCLPVVFKNIGTKQISLNGVTPVLDPFTFRDPSTFPNFLNPGDSVIIFFCYSPPTTPRRDTLRANVEVDTGGILLELDTLILVGRSAAPVLVANPNPVDFGGVTIGGQNCIPVTISNTGDAPLVIQAAAGLSSPFTVQAISNAPIPPGGTRVINFCFNPIFLGQQRDTAVFLYNVCGTPTMLPLVGIGLQPQTQIGPVLDIIPDTLDFGSTLCGTTSRRTITFRNTGTSPLTVTSVDALNLPFIGSIAPPAFTLQPNGQQIFSLDYAPTVAPRIDSQRVNLIADSRVSLSIAMVFDVSGSMTLPTTGGGAESRIQAARAGGLAFVSSMINDPGRGVIDEAAVYTFEAAPRFLRRQDYTTNQGALQTAVPNVGDATGSSTCIFDALIKTIDDLRLHNIPGRRVLVLLTDGDNSSGCPGSIAAAIAAAQANGVRIYTIGIGTSGNVSVSDLTQLATQSGGFFSLAANGTELVQVYARIAQDLSKNIPTTFLVRGRSIAPLMQVTPATVNFDSVRVGANLCRTLTISNIGDAPLDITSVAGLLAPFTLTSTTFNTIQPGTSVTVDACFTPTLLRVQRDTLLLGYTSCSPRFDTVTLQAVGYDSLVVETRDSVRGRPGSIIEIPVFLQQALPASYLVDSYVLTVTYNKTMLFPADTFVAVTGTTSQGMSATTVQRSFTDSLANTQVTMSGAVAQSATPNSTLVRLRFLVLHGDSLITPVSVTAATFADGNPKLGLANPGFFIADSLCFQQERLIDASRRIGGALNRVSRQPGSGLATVNYTLRESGNLRLQLHDNLGRLVRTIADGWADSGTYEESFEVGDLSAGTYILLLQSESGRETKLLMLTR
jgi:hypothetical protein